jgi:hypothetical protein
MISIHDSAYAMLQKSHFEKVSKKSPIRNSRIASGYSFLIFWYCSINGVDMGFHHKGHKGDTKSRKVLEDDSLDAIAYVRDVAVHEKAQAFAG